MDNWTVRVDATKTEGGELRYTPSVFDAESGTLLAYCPVPWDEFDTADAWASGVIFATNEADLAEGLSDAQRDWLARGPAEVRRLIEFATSFVHSGPDRHALASGASEALAMLDAMGEG